MPIWHKYNPWKDEIVYITLDEFLYCLHDSYQQPVSANVEDGDYYILPNTPRHSIGIRIGMRPDEYLSPLADQARTEEILMRKNAQAVIEAFNAGKAKHGETIRTDGRTIWSYAMPIAEVRSDGSIWILPYEDAPTNTTRSHVRACETLVECRHEDCHAIPGMVRQCVNDNRSRPKDLGRK